MKQGNWTKLRCRYGGIGTGNISVGGNGQWKGVEMMNKPGIGFYGSTSPKQAPCFMIFIEDGKGRKASRALTPRFASATLDAAYPFALVNLEDEQMPVSAKLKTFNPFIPQMR